MSKAAVIPNYTKVDTYGKELIYWNALGECGHITLYTIQCWPGDYIFCRRCDGPSLIKVAKYKRPQDFMTEFGGDLIT